MRTFYIYFLEIKEFWISDASQLFVYGILFAAMDISSDLIDLGRTPVAVISAGVKSILDIKRTLEYLVFYTSLKYH